MQNHWIFFSFKYLNLLAQTATSSATSTKIEILEKQVSFLSDTNKTLVANFSLFSEVFNKIFIALATVLTIAAGLATFLYWKTLEEAKEEAHKNVRREVDRAIELYVQDEVDTLRRLLERERSIFKVEIDYILSKGADKITPEYKMLRDRGFRLNAIRHGVTQYRNSRAVTIFDFVNGNPTGDEIKDDIARMSENDDINRESILIIYVSTIFPEIFVLLKPKTLFVTPANTAITLIGVAVSAASIAQSHRPSSAD